MTTSFSGSIGAQIGAAAGAPPPAAAPAGGGGGPQRSGGPPGGPVAARGSQAGADAGLLTFDSKGQLLHAIGSRFALEIDGLVSALFNECSGIGLTVATDKLEEGGVNFTTRKLPGRTDFTNLVLKHGVTTYPDLMKWVMETINGRVQRKTVTVHVIKPDINGGDIVTPPWTFVRAFPVKWTGPTFQSTANAIAIETLELAHDGFEKI